MPLPGRPFAPGSDPAIIETMGRASPYCLAG